MVKTIKIDGKEFNIKSSAYTVFAYKNMWGRDFFKDIKSVSVKKAEIDKHKSSKEEKNLTWLEEMPNILNMLYNVFYTMAQEYDNKIPEYNEWLKSIPSLYSDDGKTWMEDVLVVATAPFSR